MTLGSRDIVLGQIRRATANGVSRLDADALAQRMASPPRWTRPAAAGDIGAQFVGKAKANLVEVHSVAAAAEVPNAVAALVAERDARGTVSVAPSLASLIWPSSLKVRFDAGRDVGPVAVSDALAAIAETGSLVLVSAPDRPTSLNFLPDLHIVVLQRSAIVATFEDVWPLLRQPAPWPRTVNIISAASRTADVAQIVVRPAHGPKHLCVLLVEEP